MESRGREEREEREERMEFMKKEKGWPRSLEYKPLSS